MRSFPDNKGRQWSLSLNVFSAKRVKSETGVDLLDMDSLTAKLADSYTLAEVLWSMISKDAEAINVDAEEFGSSLSGDEVELATNALLEEIIDFFPLPRRKILIKALEKSRELVTAMTNQAETMMDNMTLGDLSGPAPASSE